jgi:hypothetical protein
MEKKGKLKEVLKGKSKKRGKIGKKSVFKVEK